MAQDIISDEVGGLDPFAAPIPGSSLTSSKESPAPYETAPEFNTPQEFIEDLWGALQEDDDLLDGLLDGMRDGIPLEDIAQLTLFGSFQAGKITPDVMMLAAEPMIYLLAFLANYAEIPAVVYPEDDMDDDLDDESNEVMARITEEMAKGNIPDTVSIGGTTLQRPSDIPESLLSAEALPPMGAGADPEQMPMSQEEMPMAPEEEMMNG